jgi:hypothetical protein
MLTFRGIREFILQRAKETEFDVEVGNFSDLEIRRGNQPNFFYFFDTNANRLIKSFVLRGGDRVDKMCDVVLIKKAVGYTPRLTFWTKDKTKGKPEYLTEQELVAEGRIVLIKARVDMRDCQENFWKLIDFLRAHRGADLPEHAFRVTSDEEVALLKALEGHDKVAVLTAVKTYLGGSVTEEDVRMLLDRKETLARFERLLTDSEFFEVERSRFAETPEGVWQRFFEDNTWIFGYGLTLVACEKYDDAKLERMTSGRNVFTGGGKRSDGVMKTKGFLQTLLFAEIKRHDTQLLMPKPYRDPDVYQVDKELTGAVSQVQKTAHKAVKKLEDLHRQSDPNGTYQFSVSTIRPRQAVVVGRLDQLADRGQLNVEKMSSFELWRKAQLGVEVVTFDELYERAKYIVESQEGPP